MENPFKPDEVDKAIKSGIEFLLSNQKDNGAIYDRGNPTAITALSLMSLAAVGHLPIHPNENGEAMAKALEFVLLEKNQDEVGYFGKDGGRMYGHGIVTLTLAEMLGMGMDEETDKSIREKCQKAIDLILRSQKVQKNQAQQGGWRYSPDSRDADLSVTIWQLMALRSAKNSGLDVPSSAISDAIEYLERSYKSKLDDQGEPIDKKSGFAYQPGGHPEYTTTAAGLLAMQVCGQYESPFVWVRQTGCLKIFRKPRKFSFMELTTTPRPCTSVEMSMRIKPVSWLRKFFFLCRRKTEDGKVVVLNQVRRCVLLVDGYASVGGKISLPANLPTIIISPVGSLFIQTVNF